MINGLFCSYLISNSSTENVTNLLSTLKMTKQLKLLHQYVRNQFYCQWLRVNQDISAAWGSIVHRWATFCDQWQPAQIFILLLNSPSEASVLNLHRHLCKEKEIRWVCGNIKTRISAKEPGPRYPAFLLRNCGMHYSKKQRHSFNFFPLRLQRLICHCNLPIR